MPKLLFSAVFAAAISLAAGAASARSGQCYTADGKPTGPAYELAEPDTDWIGYVTERGGRCTGLDDMAEDRQPRVSPHEVPHHRHLERHRLMRRH
jgi:hypothetical protein